VDLLEKAFKAIGKQGTEEEFNKWLGRCVPAGTHRTAITHLRRWSHHDNFADRNPVQWPAQPGLFEPIKPKERGASGNAREHGAQESRVTRLRADDYFRFGRLAAPPCAMNLGGFLRPGPPLPRLCLDEVNLGQLPCQPLAQVGDGLTDPFLPNRLHVAGDGFLTGRDGLGDFVLRLAFQVGTRNPVTTLRNFQVSPAPAVPPHGWDPQK
jgi:hypothetical protein